MSSCPLISFQGATSGIDEALQGLSSDPWQAAQPSAMGLRIPTLVNAPTNRYVFLLATRQLHGRTRIRGIRQYLTIGTNTANPDIEGSPVERPLELQVTTPSWHFTDGNVSWHLVLEANAVTLWNLPNSDAASSMLREADGPAFLYETATWAGGFATPASAPLYYNEGLTSYVPPQDIPMKWQPLGGLGCFYDYRFPWVTGAGHDTVNIPVEADSNVRVSLYATVLQTNGGGVALPEGIVGLPPEELFLSNKALGHFLSGVFYWRIAGDILFDDEDAWCNEDCPVGYCNNVIPFPARCVPRLACVGAR